MNIKSDTSNCLFFCERRFNNILLKLPGMRVGGEIEGAEGVTLAGHVLPKQVSSPVYLQVRLQIWLLLEGEWEICSFTFLFSGTFIVAISRSCSCFSWSMWKLDCTCLISSTSFTLDLGHVVKRRKN